MASAISGRMSSSRRRDSSLGTIGSIDIKSMSYHTGFHAGLQEFQTIDFLSFFAVLIR
ncbi:hypothetical protein OCEANICA350_20104 [Oceanicaulis sp. 350]|nr:hypothetical protein OCEANICA350_20104 [Oceanicaulis sp. 350]